MSTDGLVALDDLIHVRSGADVDPPAPSWDDAEVVTHADYAGEYRRLRLLAPAIARSARPGQFVMISVDKPGADGAVLLPRPMAIHRRNPWDGTIDLVYNVVGRGTDRLSRIAVGEVRQVVGPLGRGFTPQAEADHLLVIGRGVGICSVMGVAEDASRQGRRCTAVLSSRSAPGIGVDDLDELGTLAMAVTDSAGTSAVESLRSELLDSLSDQPPTYIAVCGSTRLIRLAAELGRIWEARVEASVEAHMACGLGYCHGCAAPLTADPDQEGPLVCVDGPVFSVKST